MPPWASSNRPLRWPTALVNAPFSWPKSSLSSSDSGRAAQLTATNGRLRRGDASCTARATSSLPVPVSPKISTVLIGLGDVADQLEHVVHPRALAQDAVEGELLVQLLAQRGDFVFERPLAKGALDHQLEMLEIDRLGQEIGRAQPHRLHGVIDRAETPW